MTSASDELKSARSELMSLLSSARISHDFQALYTERVDEYFRRSVQESQTGQKLFKDKRPFALMAVGGYGRKDLCLHSDLDILILFHSKVPSCARQLAEEIFYPLWNLGLDLGHGIRGVRECLALAGDNFEVLTSLLDGRFLCGDSPLYLGLMDSLDKKILPKKQQALDRWLLEQDRARMALFGDASHLLEPNLKQGIGGLRDYHHLWWLGKAFFHVRTPRDLERSGILSHREYEDLKTHLGFIHLVRNHLHLRSARKNDRLTFDHQEGIARRLGFRDRRNLPAVEQFLSRIHESMGSMKSLHRSFRLTRFPNSWEKGRTVSGTQSLSPPFPPGQGQIDFPGATAILSDPLLLSDIFMEAAKTGKPLSLESRRLIREFLPLVNHSVRVSRRAALGFLSVLNSPNAFEVLGEMLDTGFLCAFIPEFTRVKDRVQFDHYHFFPVGRHLLETVRQLKAFHRDRDLLLTDIFLDLHNPESLFLAALFHDIGKTGKNHAARGALRAGNILKRLGYDRKKTEDVQFLIRHHLLLAETATRRDLNDEKIVVQCARAVGTIERLKSLYLLSWADGKATGPRAWNDWVANLVLELFFKILHILEKGELATPDISKNVKHTIQQVQALIADGCSPTERETLVDDMPTSYLIETGPRAIARHVALLKSLRESLAQGQKRAFRLEAEPDPLSGTYAVTFLAEDKPGLFSDFAGVMALHNINILSARIYTWRDGTAVDLFTVTPPLDPTRAKEIWAKIEEDLAHTFQGELILPERLKQKARPGLVSPRRTMTRETRIRVDNESSDFFTLVEVFTDDRIGLLHRITHTLFNLGMNIRIAKIATKTDQVADVFYVLDEDGQKVQGDEKARRIREALLQGLSVESGNSKKEKPV